MQIQPHVVSVYLPDLPEETRFTGPELLRRIARELLNRQFLEKPLGHVYIGLTYSADTRTSEGFRFWVPLRH